MSKIIIYDFEVYKYDTLFGCIILDGEKETLYQTWNEDEIRDFYKNNTLSLYVGHNNEYYDDVILESVVKHKSAYETNKKIIKDGLKLRCHLPIYSYDLMNVSRSAFSLKLTELISGRNIHTTDVDFDIDRPLTEEEKKLTEEYNADDLKQTKYNFEMFYDLFKLRINIIKEFNLDLMSNLKVTGTKLAANVLGAKANREIVKDKIEPILWPTLRLKNKRLLDFYLNEEFRQNKSDVIHVAGADITIAAGGAHSAIRKFHADKVMYLDVSGYYNLIMINLDLLPRTMPKEAKDKYIFMYHEQLRLKKINPVLRAMYKTILLSVFGAMNNEYTDFYDPWKALLVTITGQLFIVDLLEKLEGLITVVQTNTDGIMIIPNDWDKEDEIIKIVEEWEQRTGFVIKKEHVYNLWQRDVNCYVCEDENGNLDFKGEALVNYRIDKERYASCKIFECKEPPIIAQGIVNYLMYNKLPEQTIEETKTEYNLYQYACKKKSYDYMTLDRIETTHNDKGKEITTVVSSEKVAPICRAFAKKITDNSIDILIKHKVDKNGKNCTAKVSNLPPSIFIYNYSIEDKEKVKELSNMINYQYYIDRIYERIQEFIDIPTAKDLL